MDIHGNKIKSEPLEDSDTRRQTQTAAAPEIKTDIVLTVEDDDEKTVQIGDLGIDLYKVLHNPQIL